LLACPTTSGGGGAAPPAARLPRRPAVRRSPRAWKATPMRKATAKSPSAATTQPWPKSQAGLSTTIQMPKPHGEHRRAERHGADDPEAARETPGELEIVAAQDQRRQQADGDEAAEPDGRGEDMEEEQPVVQARREHHVRRPSVGCVGSRWRFARCVALVACAAAGEPESSDRAPS
jgi:hypothetical protein